MNRGMHEDHGCGSGRAAAGKGLWLGRCPGDRKGGREGVSGCERGSSLPAERVLLSSPADPAGGAPGSVLPERGAPADAAAVARPDSPRQPRATDASPSCGLPGGKGRGTGCRGGAGLGSSAGKGFSRGNSSFCPAQPALPPRGTRRCQRRPHLTLTVGCELLMAMQLLVPASLLQTAAAAPRSWGG